ncbi:MAG: hypothetical protein GX616_22145, partial [Planctomycetes bacterium]|nr:hypothetical protein [Planctomycetota bacterium]
DGLSLTATFAIAADAPVGLYTDKVARPEAYCDPATASGGFEVVLPGLSNGNFNGDASSIAECTPGTLSPNLPKDWQASEAGTWGYDSRLNLNGYRPTPIDTLPTCPVPGTDGYYGTIASTSNNPGAQAQAWQSFSVTAGQTYVVSGKFAGSGDCTVTLRLLDGLRRNGTELASKVVRDTAGFFDWTTDFVTAEAPVGGTGVMTFVWEVARNSGNDNASHADKFELTVCSSPIDVTGVTPSLGVNNGILSITDLAGTGFSDAAGTPTVLLAKVGGGTTITASNVVVVSGTQITCDFDLTGAASGRYDLTVFQDGCIDTLPSSVMVVGESFVNGSFELPENTQDPCTGQIGGLPTGWNTDAPSGLNRDGQAPPPNPCPSSDGGHYGSMSEGSAATVRAWQTVQVSGGNYEFSGLFNVPVGVTVTLRLLDGDESGTQLAESSVPVEVDTWTEGSVSANAPTSGIMTVVWEMQLTGTEPAVGGSADGLKFESTCHNPVFDFDGDGDVDQADFAAFQVCYTGATGTLPAGCECADSNGDKLVTQSDATDFETCASGPGIPANPDCD